MTQNGACALKRRRAALCVRWQVLPLSWSGKIPVALIKSEGGGSVWTGVQLSAAHLYMQVLGKCTPHGCVCGPAAFSIPAARRPKARWLSAVRSDGIGLRKPEPVCKDAFWKTDTCGSLVHCTHTIGHINNKIRPED